MTFLLSTHEYDKRWEEQPPREYGSCLMTLSNFELVTFFISHTLIESMMCGVTRIALFNVLAEESKININDLVKG